MTEGQMLFHWATKHQRTRYGNAPSTTHLSKTANCTLWQEWKLYPLDRQAWIWSWVEVSMYVMLRTTVHLCNIGCFQSNRVCQNSDLFRKRRHWNKPQKANFFKQQKGFGKKPEEQNTRTAPEEVLQFVQKNAQQSKLTTVNKLQAPQHLFCFSEKGFSSSTCFAIHAKHQCDQRIRQSSLCQRGRAYSLETKAVDSKGLLQTQNKRGRWRREIRNTRGTR